MTYSLKQQMRGMTGAQPPVVTEAPPVITTAKEAVAAQVTVKPTDATVAGSGVTGIAQAKDVMLKPTEISAPSPPGWLDIPRAPPAPPAGATGSIDINSLVYYGLIAFLIITALGMVF